MKYFLILMLLFLLPLPQIASAEDIATAIKQGDPTKLKLIPYATSTVGWIPLKATTEGYLGVYDYSSGSAGTTTSNMYITDGSQWVGLKGNTVTGRAYVEMPAGTITRIIDPVTVQGTVTVTSESGTNLRRTYLFSNVTTGVWVEVGSYTVPTGKNLKIHNYKATGHYVISYKISDGTTTQDVYLATSPSTPNDGSTQDKPIVEPAGTIIRIYVKTAEAVNEGTVSWNGIEY